MMDMRSGKHSPQLEVLRVSTAKSFNNSGGTNEEMSLHCVWLTLIQSSSRYLMSLFSSLHQIPRLSRCNNHRRTRKKTTCSFLSILPVFALLTTSCSTTPNLWYKTGATQTDFNLDSRECVIIAKKFALLQSETGKSIDQVDFSQNYRQCINSKGWSRNSSAADQTTDQSATSPPPLNIEQDGTTLSGFGLHLVLPANFTLVKSQDSAIGPTTKQQFLWKDDSNTFINIIFQKNNNTRFEISPYPLSEPYQLYTSRTRAKTQDLLQWSTFFGKIKDDWVMGVGSFYLASKTERLIIVITKELDPPTDAPPANLTLSSNQHDQIETFSNHWSAWLESQFPRSLSEFEISK